MSEVYFTKSRRSPLRREFYKIKDLPAARTYKRRKMNDPKKSETRPHLHEIIIEKQLVETTKNMTSLYLTLWKLLTITT